MCSDRCERNGGCWEVIGEEKFKQEWSYSYSLTLVLPFTFSVLFPPASPYCIISLICLKSRTSEADVFSAFNSEFWKWRWFLMNNTIIEPHSIITLAKEVKWQPAFVFLFVIKVTRKAKNGFWWHFQEVLIMSQGTDYINVDIPDCGGSLKFNLVIVKQPTMVCNLVWLIPIYIILQV